jgi:hypothetical protein
MDKIRTKLDKMDKMGFDLEEILTQFVRNKLDKEDDTIIIRGFVYDFKKTEKKMIKQLLDKDKDPLPCYSTLPIEESHLAVTGTLNQEPVRMLVSTETTHTVIGRNLVNKLGLKLEKSNREYFCFNEISEVKIKELSNLI